MEHSMDGFRALYESLAWNYKGTDIYSEVLLAYEKSCKDWMKPLEIFGDSEYRHRKNRTNASYFDEEFLLGVWGLYALSRINDVLLMAFQPGDGIPIGKYVPNMYKVARSSFNLGEYMAFMAELGLKPVYRSKFHPFYHEIVSVEQAENPDEPIQIVEEVWPCYMLGQLMFSRAGVKVRAGEKQLVKALAEKSTLYWSYIRLHRATNDYSMGWGSNSQWRTGFRRDYLDSDCFYYNVDDKSPLPANPVAKPTNPYEKWLLEVGMNQDEWIDLLRYRCLTKRIPDCGDELLYGFSYQEQKLD